MTTRSLSLAAALMAFGMICKAPFSYVCLSALVASELPLACVCLLVLLQSRRSNKSELALVTAMRLCFRMFSCNVAFQLLFGCGRKLAGRASVRLFPRVNLFVALQMRRITCCIFTLTARIRLLASVLHYMGLEMTSQSGFIFTLIARIWLLSRVLHNVRLEITSLSCFIMALVARI